MKPGVLKSGSRWLSGTVWLKDVTVHRDLIGNCDVENVYCHLLFSLFHVRQPAQTPDE